MTAPSEQSRRGGRNLSTGGPDGDSPTVQARLHRHVHVEFCAACDRLGITLSDALRAAIDAWLDAVRDQTPEGRTHA